MIKQAYLVALLEEYLRRCNPTHEAGYAPKGWQGLSGLPQRTCWLVVEIAAGSVGISGRGGWSVKRGELLKARAELLRRPLTKTSGWEPGPITLGADGTFLHTESGQLRQAGRAYECGTILARRFDPREPPSNLAELALDALRLTQSTVEGEGGYVESLVPPVTERDQGEQDNAAILGDRAERHFLEWCRSNKAEWGEPDDRTRKVGLGFDVHFPEADLFVEIKGFRQQIDAIRMTRKEWEAAEKRGRKYVLALVSQLDRDGDTEVQLLRNPYARLSASVQPRKRLQVTFSLPGAAVRAAVRADENSGGT